MEASDIHIHGNSWTHVDCILRAHAVLQIGVASVCGDDKGICRSLSSLNINLKRSMELPQHVPGGLREEQLGNTGTETGA